MNKNQFFFRNVFCLFFISICFCTSNATNPVKIICLGNSITNGAPVYPPYPKELGILLDKRYGTGKYIVENYGVGGTTMSKIGNKPYWNQDAFNNAKESNPDFVIIKFGTNDSKPSNWPAAASTYTNDIAEMVSIFSELPSKPKIFLGIPTWVSEDVFNIRGDMLVNEITPVIRETAIALKIDTIDFYSPLKGRSELYMDGVHLKQAGAVVLAQAALDVISKEIDKESGIKQTNSAHRVYPTLVGPKENIHININTSEKTKANVYNLCGMLIESKHINNIDQINAPRDTGLYVLKIENKTSNEDFKIIVR
ncbi:MAG: SGNH/GDSL hydrolase family protein [Paludibacteraceae bacterium]